MKPLHQQVVVVVGASSGIGRETARRFARRGARVVVAARSRPALASLVNEIESAGGRATARVADVTDFAQMEALADAAVATYGQLDTWVHLAAVGMWATVEQTTPAEFRRIIDVNLTGQAYGAMAALPHLRRTGRGALIHVSSGEGKLALPLQGAYSASKHGVVALLDALRIELQHEGVPISVTNVMPSSINTPFFNKAGTKLGVKPRPLPPMYQPRLVADAILFAAEHPTPELVVGGAARVGIFAKHVVPRLVDAVLARVGIRLQRTSEPKSDAAPHNLYAALPDEERIEGDFGPESRSWSVYTTLVLHPTARHLGTGAAVIACALAAREYVKRSRPL